MVGIWLCIVLLSLWFFDVTDKARNMYQDDLKKIHEKGIIPVVVIEDPEKAPLLGETLIDAGLDIIEVTMRTKSAMDAIKLVKDQLPEMILGAGTVFSLSIAKEAIKNGVRFIVSPHLDEEIVTYCIDNDVPVCPGIYTPTEVNRALKAANKNKRVEDANDLPILLKIFPASSGGPEHLKAMRAVFPNSRFIPLGGINASNVADFIKAGAWAVGGTWICKKDMIDRGEMNRISELTKEALHLISEARQG